MPVVTANDLKTKGVSYIERMLQDVQYRITLELELREQEIILVKVGSHDEIY